MLHAIIFYLFIPGLAVGGLCLAMRKMRTHEPVPAILRGWLASLWNWVRNAYYGMRAADDQDVISGIPAPATEGPAPAAVPLPPPPAAASAPPAVNVAAPAGPAGGGVPATGAAQDDLMYFVSGLVSEASNGDIKDVRRVVATFAAADEALAGGKSALSRRLAEPDKDYDAAIWEPLQTAAANSMAASLHCGDSDASLQAVLSSTVADLADSPMRAPHNSQMNGGNG